MTIEIPARLDWLKGSGTGRTWLDGLPAAVEACVERWELVLGAPFATAFTSLAMPATLPDGAEAVLKISFPDRESEHEALALESWKGDGAIRLLDHDPALSALLVERCIPGTPLSNMPQDAALDVVAGLLRRLWIPAASPPFRALSDEAAWWTAHLRKNWILAGRPFEEQLLDAALDAMRVLPGSQGEPVLLHQDLHGDNVLRAEREPWLVIDPKPLVGEREFGLAPIVRSFEFGHGREELRRRLDHLTSNLGVDRERARLWCVAQTVAWSIGSEYLPRHIETATWLLEM